jgi:glycerophosphoryl diester phosphodiesterase
VIGHRGSPLRRPENTLESFREAIAEGADLIEVDVRTTADGRLVAFHDETLERMARNPRGVADLSWAAVSSVELDGGGRIPLLEDVLALGSRAMLDVKSADAGSVLEAVDRAGARQGAWLSSFDHVFLARAAELGAAPLGYLVRPGTMFTELEGRELRPGGLGFVLDPVSQEEIVELESLRFPAGSMLNVPHFMMVNEPEFARRLIDHFHRGGVKVNVWTVNDPAEARALAAAGADGLITDRPGEIVGTLGRE